MSPLVAFLRQNPPARPAGRAEVEAAIARFALDFPAYATRAGASCMCWKASADFLQRLRDVAAASVRRVCFCRSRDALTRCAGRGHSHRAEDYPLAAAWTRGDASSHQYVAVYLPSTALGVDFTARQFDESAPFPMVWRLP